MAFPWIFECNFENTTTPFGWDSESDTGTKLDVASIETLARLPGSECAPYRGASALRIQMGDTNAHTLTEGDIDIADTATAHVRFYLYLAPDVAATADDSFQLLELQQAGGTVECSLGLRITAATGAIAIGIGDGTAPSAYSAQNLTRNCWYCIEWSVKISSTGAGTQTLYVDGVSRVALASLTNAAGVGQGVLGTQATLATTTGTILIDQFVFDDARVYPITTRFPDNLLLTQSGHACLGSGVIDNVSLFSGAGTDCVLSIYDTGAAETTDASRILVELKNTTNSELIDPAGMPVTFHRGAWVAISGTTPRALVQIRHASGYGSSAVLRRHGQLARPRPGLGSV